MRGIIGLIAVAGVATAASAQVWSQPYDPNCPACGYYSDGQSGYFYSQRIADNFNLGGSTTIDRVKWWGASEFYIFPDLSNFSGWTVAFYDAGFSAVGSETISKANITIPDLGAIGIFGQNLYEFDVTLTNPVTVDNGWISIGSHNISPFDDAFVWNFSVSGDVDGTIAADFFDGNGFQVFQGASDVAFQLFEIPAPGTLALVGLGGLVAARRRR